MAKHNTNKTIVIVVIVALVTSGVVLSGLFQLGNTKSSQMVITFFDIVGNELGTTQASSITPLTLHQEGFEGEIYSMLVVVYFRVTTSITTTPDTRCWITITTTPRGYMASPVNTLEEHRLGWSNADLEGSFYRTTNEGLYYMSEVLPESAITESGKTEGWIIVFNARVETTIADPDNAGQVLTVATTCGTTLQIVWNAPQLEVESWFGDVP